MSWSHMGTRLGPRLKSSKILIMNMRNLERKKSTQIIKMFWICQQVYNNIRSYTSTICKFDYDYIKK